MMAQEANLELGEFSHYINDAHIYKSYRWLKKIKA